MAYNPGVQDRSGEILAQGISQGFSSLTRGIELGAQRRKEKEDEIKTSNAALKSFESTMKGLIDAGMMKPEMLDSITDARGMDSKGRMEFVTRGFQSLPAFLSANQIQTERAKSAAALEQNRLAQQDFANINAPTQSQAQNQIGMGASFEQLSQAPNAFQQGIPDLNAKIQRVYAAPNIDPDKKPGIINALIAQDEAGKPPKPPTTEKVEETDLNGNPVTVTYRVDANGNRVEIGRQLTGNPGMRIVSGGTGLQPITGSAQDSKAEGSPAQIAAKRASTDAATEARQVAKAEEIKKERATKFIRAAESRKTELQNTLKLVDEATALSQGGAGGALDKFTTSFGTKTATLQNKIGAIRSNLALGKMAELKSLSPTGSTGFANQSDKEGSLMQDYLGVLDVGTNEKETQSTLKDIRDHILRQLDGYNPKSALEVSSEDDSLLNEFGIDFKNK